MRAALLLIDTQRDFFSRPGLSPAKLELIPQIRLLLEGFRSLDLPVFHIHTEIRPDGNNRMPHWEENDIRQCIKGSPGAQPPEQLRPLSSEIIITKQYFSAFGNSKLTHTLQHKKITHLIIAGIYLHGCIRSTVMDAYEQGYTIWVADNAVGSTEAVHAEITREYLEGRAASFLPCKKILGKLGFADQAFTEDIQPFPVACINNNWNPGTSSDFICLRNPINDTSASALVSIANKETVDNACKAAKKAAQPWHKIPPQERSELLKRWATLLEKHETLATTLCSEIGKPINDTQDEIKRTIAHIHAASDLCLDDSNNVTSQNPQTHYRPVGTVALITPWNNPLAIPGGKIAPAIALGNTCVWKPSPYTPRCATLLLDTLIEAGLMPGVVSLVHGDSSTSRELAGHRLINAVSVTGSFSTGQCLAALCTVNNKPLQAELGGNNAAIILDDWHYDDNDLLELLMSAFSFSGQRCTAIRRFIVQKNCFTGFKKDIIRVLGKLKIGDPSQPDTQIGPLISKQHRGYVQAMVDDAMQNGARIIASADLPKDLKGDCWMAPVFLGDIARDSEIAQQESFGPVALLITAEDLKEAVTIANDVPQGLVASLYTNNPESKTYFREHIEAGILNLKPGTLSIHPRAPFAGWKSSSIGPPEHGIWDRNFYTRPQAVYNADTTAP